MPRSPGLGLRYVPDAEVAYRTGARAQQLGCGDPDQLVDQVCRQVRRGDFGTALEQDVPDTQLIQLPQNLVRIMVLDDDKTFSLYLTQNHPERLLDHVDTAHGQLRVVGTESPGSHHHRVHSRAKPVYPGAGLLAGDPATTAISGGDVAVERARDFERDERTARTDREQPRFEEVTGLLSQGPGRRLDAVRTQELGATAGHRRGVSHGVPNSTHTGVDQRLGTGRGEAVMVAGLQRHVRGGSPGALSGSVQRDDFGVRSACPLMSAACHDLPVAVDEHTTDSGVGTDSTMHGGGQAQRLRHVFGVHRSPPTTRHGRMPPRSGERRFLPSGL